MTTQDEREWWNEVWGAEEEMSSAPDEVLVSEIGSLSPGRALEIACGTGANAVWLAQLVEPLGSNAVEGSQVCIEHDSAITDDHYGSLDARNRNEGRLLGYHIE